VRTSWSRRSQSNTTSGHPASSATWPGQAPSCCRCSLWSRTYSSDEAPMMNYPRPGEPIVPRLLRPLVIDRRPSPVPLDSDTELLARDELSASAWGRLMPETCRRVSLLVIDRVQTRLRSLPDAIRDTVLLPPEAALALPIERRTSNTLRRTI